MYRTIGSSQVNPDSHKEWAIYSRYCSFGRNVLVLSEKMNERAGDITSFNVERKSKLDYLFLVGGWLVSCISLVIVGLISYWAIKIPEKNVNSLPIINAIKGDIRVEPAEPGGKSFNEEDLKIYQNL